MTLKLADALIGSLPAIYDEPRPCKGEFVPFDDLVDGDANERRYAARTVASLCESCPIGPTFDDKRRITRLGPCWALNRDEEWVQVLLGKKTARAPSTRAARLEEMVAAGANLAAALAYFKITESSMRAWCNRNERVDLWQALTSGDGEADDAA